MFFAINYLNFNAFLLYENYYHLINMNFLLIFFLLINLDSFINDYSSHLSQIYLLVIVFILYYFKSV